MKSLFETETHQDILNRIEKLNESSSPNWGKMNVGQMLKHCQKPMEIALGKREMKGKAGFFTKIIFKLFKPMMYNDRPWKRNIGTAKEFVITGPQDFETEKNYNNFEFTELGLQDMPALDRFDGRSIRKETLQKRIKQGHKCFALKTDGSIAAFTWCNPNEIHHYKLSSRTLKQREAYLYDAQTHYNFRGRNLAPYLRYKSYYALNLMGFDILYSCSDYFNRPAIRFKQKLNARFLSIGMNLNLIGLYKKSWVIKQLADVEIMDNKV